MGQLWVPGLQPPAGSVRWMEVWSPSGVGPYEVTVLADDVTMVICHWSGRTVPCPGPEVCPYCATGADALFYGFVPAVVGSPVHDECVVRLTPAATDGALTLRDHLNGKLRGAVLKLWRRSGGCKARLRIALDRLKASRECPAGWDVLPHLRRLWNCGDHYPLHTDADAWAAKIPTEGPKSAIWPAAARPDAPEPLPIDRLPNGERGAS